MLLWPHVGRDTSLCRREMVANGEFGQVWVWEKMPGAGRNAFCPEQKRHTSCAAGIMLSWELLPSSYCQPPVFFLPSPAAAAAAKREILCLDGEGLVSSLPLLVSNPEQEQNHRWASVSACQRALCFPRFVVEREPKKSSHPLPHLGSLLRLELLPSVGKDQEKVKGWRGERERETLPASPGWLSKSSEFFFIGMGRKFRSFSS